MTKPLKAMKQGLRNMCLAVMVYIGGLLLVTSVVSAHTLHDEGDYVRWVNDVTEVVVSKTRGLTGIIDRRTGTDLLGTGVSYVEIRAEPDLHWALVREVSSWRVDGDTLKLTSTVGDVVVEQHLTLRSHIARPWVERRLLVYSTKPHVLTGVRLAVNVAGHGLPKWQYGNMVVQGPLAVTYWGQIDFGHFRVEGPHSFSHESAVVAKLGAAVEPVLVGTQYLYATEGEGAEAIHDFYRLTGLGPADDTPEWLQGSVMYSGHPGGRIESTFADVGGFDAMRSRLPYLRDLGIDIVWLLPVFQFNVPPSRNFGIPYGVYDFYAIEAALGGEAAARAYVETAHALGMKVILDTVPHGGYTPLFEGHPEWLTYGRDMKPHAVFGYGPDYSQPGWQAVMQDVARHWTERLDIDGFRIDLGVPYEPSWDLPRPSASTLGGAVGMTKAIRDGFRSVKSSPFIYSEMLKGDPMGEIELTPYVDANYGWSFFNRISDLWDSRSPIATWPGALKRLLHDEYFAFPPDHHFVRFITNHDMTRDYTRPVVRFGPGMTSALMALASFVDGIPFVYQGQEVGVGETLKQLFALRKAVPQLQDDVPLYGATSANSGVISFARVSEEGYAVPIVNFNPFPVEADVDVTDLDLPLRNVSVEMVYDAVGGELWPFDGQRVSIPMESFGAAVLLFPTNDLSEVPSPRTHQTIAPVVEPDISGDSGTKGTEYAALHLEPSGRIVLPAMVVEPNALGLPDRVTVAVQGSEQLLMGGSVFTIAESPLDTLNVLPLLPPVNRAVRVVSPAEWDVSPDGMTAQATSQAFWSDRFQDVPLTVSTKYTRQGDRLAVDVEITLHAELALRWGTVEMYWALPGAQTWAANTKYGLYHDGFAQWSPNFMAGRPYGREVDEFWGNRFVPYRLWTSALHPLHARAPFVALASGEQSLTVTFHTDRFDVYITDGSDLRESHGYLHVTWLDPLAPEPINTDARPLSAVKSPVTFDAGHTFSVSFTLTPGSGGLIDVKQREGGPFSYELPEVLPYVSY